MKPLLGHGLPTSGYKGWIPLKFREGKDVHGRVKYSEGWKNVDNNEEWIPPEGHNGEPPYPTGELVKHYKLGGTPELWESFRQKAIADAQKEGKMPPMWTRIKEK